MQGAKRNLRYLYGISKLKLVHRKQEKPGLLLEKDADWSANQKIRKSTTSFQMWLAQSSYLKPSEKATNSRAFKS